MDDDSLHGGYWKQSLYLLQEKAPKPKAVYCNNKAPLANRPSFYGAEFHGLIERSEADKMLTEVGEGAYLVRSSNSKKSTHAFTLCILFDGNVLNYKLFFDGAHYVGEKRFDTLYSLVEDGLISMFVEKHASDYIKTMADEAIYEHSPYSQHYNNRSSATNPSGNDYSSFSSKSSSNGLRSSQQPIPRCHNFTPFTFKMPHYCDYCRNFLWGIVQQGVRCSDCGFSAHKKCSEKARHDCQPEAKYVKRMFAVDLTTLCMAHDVHVPPVLQQCIQEIEQRGLHIEGIYRVSGSHDQMERLRRQFDFSSNVDLSQVEDIHTVAGLLKLYLRLLPQQLVPFSVFKSLLAAYNTYRSVLERVKYCRIALQELNDANLNTLRVLLAHLRLVAENCAENKMSAENLATIFSPTIFCTGTVPALPQQQHMLLHFLIVNKSVTK